MLNFSASLGKRRSRMRQYDARSSCAHKGWVAVATWIAAALMISMAPAVRADVQPDAAMLKTVRRLADYMSTLPRNGSPTMFATHGVCIVENFAPFVFCGPDATKRWDAGFREHSRQEALEHIHAHFGLAHDFSRDGSRVYFSLPTKWTGLTNGHPFIERGAWAFVLRRGAGGWRILGYGWGVYAYQEKD